MKKTTAEAYHLVSTYGNARIETSWYRKDIPFSATLTLATHKIRMHNHDWSSLDTREDHLLATKFHASKTPNLTSFPGISERSMSR